LKIADLIPAAAIVHRLEGPSAGAVVAELAGVLGRVHGLDAAAVREALLEREQLGSTAIGNGVAAPHARLKGAPVAGALGILPRGVDFGAADGRPVRIVVAFVSPAQGPAHLKALAAVAQTFADAPLRQALLDAKDAAEIHDLLSRAGG
jgi:PTS system nitrogen regulatory IIA component